MPKSPFTLDPAPLLFDVSTLADGELAARIERVALEHIELAPNPRREIGEEGIDRLAKMLCSSGQLVPCIGWRPDVDQPKVILYDGQRRYLAAQASHGLAGSEYMQGPAEPIGSLIMLLLDHAPSPEEIRRLQAHCQQREALTLADQQQQFQDCWQARAGLSEADRVAAVCADLGISPKRAHNLRRQLTLPEQIRTRVAERPTGEQISATMANKLADIHELAFELTEAVAKRITTSDLHDKALRDLGAFVHRTVVEDEHTYAVRIDDGALLDAAEQIDHARGQLSDSGRRQIAGILGCEPDRLDRELDTLAARAKSHALKLRITAEVRDRASNGRYAFVHDRGRDFAAGVWVVDPAFMIDLVHEQIQEDDTAPAREEAYLAGARIDDDELRDAAAEDEQRRAQARARHAEATRSNLGLGHDIRAGLIQPAKLNCTRCARSSVACSSAITASWSPTAPAGPTPNANRPSATPAATKPAAPTRSSPPSSTAHSETPTRCAGSRSSPPGSAPPSRSTLPGSPAPRRSEPSGWPESSATRSPVARTTCGPPCGSSCARCSRPHSSTSTATRSSSRMRSRRPSTRQGCSLSSGTQVTPLTLARRDEAVEFVRVSSPELINLVALAGCRAPGQWKLSRRRLSRSSGRRPLRKPA
jgi:hypothetical protein